MDIGEAEVSTLVAVSQPCMVDSQQVQDSRIQIMDMHRAGDPAFFGRLGGQYYSVGIGDVVDVVISFPIGDPWFDFSASHPSGKTMRMVVTSVSVLSKSSLAVDGSPELSPQMTRISSSMPRCLRSVIKAAHPWSISLHCEVRSFGR